MPADALSLAVLLICGYLLGSLSSAIICCRLMGRTDPRTGGSGNPGATNVLRLAGRDAAVLTLAGDVAKGALAVAFARTLDAEPLVQALAGATAFLGHLYPVFFGFRGGKGVATALGALLVATPVAGLLTVATWGIAWALIRISAAAALTAFALAPVYVGVTTHQPPLVLVAAAVSVLLFWRHRANIRDLLGKR
ncbi:glycerol-3-phosphate 1-O-acyltransferase PlsY [Halofilum ochraceum]|uniref:glycerol-3-phosphate 1-O-acyltransferase PlsY n=1 Tax=Halofilum ochraceum TaxID=1611323 RepID=UPI001FE18775|nr:glycerol-3-phosphate 1-O-acyltransferase PlsY [Halofilum ochraceum]